MLNIFFNKLLLESVEIENSNYGLLSEQHQILLKLVKLEEIVGVFKNNKTKIPQTNFKIRG